MLKKSIRERMCRVICEGDAGVTELATGRGKDSPKGWARILRKAGQGFSEGPGKDSPKGRARILRKAGQGFAKSVPHRSLGVASPHLDAISKHTLSFICALKVSLG